MLSLHHLQLFLNSLLILLVSYLNADAQGTRLLRQPTISAEYIAFTYGGDIWRADHDGKQVRRITSTAAVESDPYFSPDGNWLAFTSNRSYSADGQRIAIDKMSRWDGEWRAYRGGQNTPLILLDLSDQSEVLLPNESTTDIQPLWLGDELFFLSDRDWTMNVWAYSVRTGALRQVSSFQGTDVKWLGGRTGQLIIEQNGYLHRLDPTSGAATQLDITVIGDFPWAETKWEDVSKRATAVSLSPSGKRAVMEARGEIFTVPVEHGDPRNLTQSSDAADRNPIWSPKKDQVAWFSDAGGKGYTLLLADQDGMSEPKSIAIGESKMAWDPVWSPDGAFIAFADDDVRIQIVELATGKITTADVGGNNLDRGRSGLTWSPDSKKLAYVKSGENNFRRVMVHDLDSKAVNPLTDPFADAFSPAWDRDQKHLYFLASTDLALGSGWANTSAIQADPSYAAYVIVLQQDQKSPFIPRSDEEELEEEKDKADENAKEAETKKKKLRSKKFKISDILELDSCVEGEFRLVVHVAIALKSSEKPLKS